MSVKMNKNDTIVVLEALSNQMDHLDSTIRFYSYPISKRAKMGQGDNVQYWRRRLLRMRRVHEKIRLALWSRSEEI